MFFHRLLDYRKAEVESLAQLFLDDNDNDKWSSLEWRLPLHHHPDSPFHYVNLPSEDVARNIANRSTHHPPLNYVFVFLCFCFCATIFNMLFLTITPFYLVGVWWIVGILVKGIYEIWGEGSSYEELEESIRSYPDERKLPYLEPGTTFKITVDSFGKVISFQDQNDRIKRFTYIPFKVIC